MNKVFWVLIFILCLLIVSSAVGFGVYKTTENMRQKEVDKLVAELSLLTSEKRSLEADINTAKNEIKRMSTELDRINNAFENAKSDISKRELYLHLWYIQKGMRTSFVISVSASFLANDLEYKDLQKIIVNTFDYYSMELDRLQTTDSSEEALIARAKSLYEESIKILQKVRTTDFLLIKPEIDSLMAAYEVFEKDLNSYASE